jgi:hypothetical protein
MQVYAKQAKDTALITQATEIRIGAERPAGELPKVVADNNERHSGRGDQKTGSQAATPKSKDLGIGKTQSSRWRALAALDDDRRRSGISPKPISAITSKLMISMAKLSNGQNAFRTSRQKYAKTLEK